MSRKSELAAKIEVKKTLAAKYHHLAKISNSVPRRGVYVRRAEFYRREAERLERTLPT